MYIMSIKWKDLYFNPVEVKAIAKTLECLPDNKFRIMIL
jgi:hypothetical protein